MSIISQLPVPRGAIRRRQCLTSTLQVALKPPAVVGYGGEEGSPTGINLVPGIWEPPTVVTEDDLASARVWLHAYETEKATVAETDCKKWLATLVNGVVKGMAYSERDLDLKICTLAAAIDDRAAKHFGKDALKLAWARFNYIPSAHELMGFFDDLEAAERAEAQNLMKILDGGVKGAASRPSPQDRNFTWSKAEAEAHGRRLYEEKAKECAEMMRILGADQHPVPPRASDEDEKAYVKQLAKWSGEKCAIGGQHRTRMVKDRLKESYGVLTGKPFIERKPPVPETPAQEPVDG
jgi:hypothetical protein